MSLPMEKAKYHARATNAPIGFGWSKNRNRQISVEFEIVDHAEFAGEATTWITTFTDNTTERIIESLLYAGWQGDDLDTLEGVPGSSVLPDIVQLVCEPEEYEGEWRLRVQWVNRVTRFAFKEPIDKNDLRTFGAQMRNTVKSLRAQGGQRRQSNGGGSAGGSRTTEPHPNAPGSSTPPRDDIPF